MPGVLQLVERCQVFDRQYIKCMIQASKIARAVMNDYPLKFQFQEINQEYVLNFIDREKRSVEFINLVRNCWFTIRTLNFLAVKVVMNCWFSNGNQWSMEYFLMGFECE